jgi:hypothetical protein
MAAPTTAQYILSKVKGLGMPLPMDMLPMDISIPPIDISILKQSNGGDRESVQSASCEADAAVRVVDSRSKTDQYVEMACVD